MTILYGVDGCTPGWLSISKNLITGKIEPKVHLTAGTLVEQINYHSIVAIDIPIGLTDAGSRESDILARKLLGEPRRRSVFPAPIRPALNARTREEASEITKAVDGRGVSTQSWGLYEKIREVDSLLRNDLLLQKIVYEVHPELSFMAWNGGIALPNKKRKPEGKFIRTELVTSYFGQKAFRLVREKYRPGLVTDDDINDAFAALWTAERISTATAQVIPTPPKIDSMGIQMAMWY